MEQQGKIEERQKASRRIFWLQVAFVSVVVSSAISLGVLAFMVNRQQHSLANQIAMNRTVVVHLCKTSGGLASVLRSGADEGEANFKNGTYANYLKKGLVSQVDLDRISSKIVFYRNTARDLTKPGNPCESVS